jgi:hypothetical protein
MNDRIYNNSKVFLSALKFYTRDYFKTQYVYGLGRTEDVPYGYSFSTTSGFIRQFDTQRPYIGINLEYLGAFKSGSFYQIDFSAASYFWNQTF